MGLGSEFIHLPSSGVTQRYRMKIAYEGSLNDEAALDVKICHLNTTEVYGSIAKFDPMIVADAEFHFEKDGQARYRLRIMNLCRKRSN